MKKENASLAFALAAVFVLILSILIPKNINPDIYGKSLSLQASQFKNGESITQSEPVNTQKNGGEVVYKVYTGGYILGTLQKVMSEKNAWKLISIFCAAASALLLYLTLSSFSPKDKTLVLMPLILTFPGIIKGCFCMSGYIVTFLFMSLLVFVLFIKTDYFLKWYLASLCAAFVFIDLPFMCILFYAIPVAAFVCSKKYRTASKSFLLSLGVLMFGIALHVFCFFMYKSKAPAFENFNLSNIRTSFLGGLTVFFVISLIGIFKCPKYTKQYIIPALFVYPVFVFSSMFSHNVSLTELLFFPPMFLGFATSVIHQKFYRKYFGFVLVFAVIISVVMISKNISFIINTAK